MVWSSLHNIIAFDTLYFLSSAHSSHPETRIRYWNAYMLFYEAIEHPKKNSLSSAQRSSDTNPMSPLTSDGDKLSQLQVQKCVYHCIYVV